MDQYKKDFAFSIANEKNAYVRTVSEIMQDILMNITDAGFKESTR